MSFVIEIADQQASHAIDSSRLTKVVRAILEDAGTREAEISVAIVTNDRMRGLNRQFLGHDYPTDVLSFVLDQDAAAAYLLGEIIVSADYAAHEAPKYGWTTGDELLLYVIHGCLHLIGHDDTTPAAKEAMRQAEAKYLSQYGLDHRYDDQ